MRVGVVTWVLLFGCQFDRTGVPSYEGGVQPDLSIDSSAVDLWPDSRTDVAPPDLLLPDTQPCTQWALRFDGNEWADTTGLDSVLAPSDNFSVGVWLKASTLHPSGEYQVVSRHNHGLSLGYVLLVKQKHPEFRTYHGLKGGCPCADTSTDLKTDQWYHLGGSFSKGTARLFLNGMLLKTCPCPDKTLVGAVSPLRVAASSENAYAYQFLGIIDDLLLTKQVWHASFAAKKISTDCTNVIARYPFAEGNGQVTVPDCGGAPALKLGLTSVGSYNDPHWVETECVVSR